MTVARGAIAGSEAAAREARAWTQLRADDSIQFAPVAPPPPPQPPEWLLAIGRFLERVLGPIGEALGVNWQVVQWVLLSLAAAGAVWIVWRIARPWLGRRRPRAAPAEWLPPREAALALLEDADRLAAEGRFDEAAHLLLQRSVGQIAEARPGLLSPASTAREIGTIKALPDRAKEAFVAIAAAVERSRYALRGLVASDWQRARAAYAEFALDELNARR